MKSQLLNKLKEDAKLQIQDRKAEVTRKALALKEKEKKEMNLWKI